MYECMTFCFCDKLHVLHVFTNYSSPRRSYAEVVKTAVKIPLIEITDSDRDSENKTSKAIIGKTTNVKLKQVNFIITKFRILSTVKILKNNKLLKNRPNAGGGIKHDLLAGYLVN